MGGFFSSDCPKGTTKKGWWTARCYPDSGYKLKKNGASISRGDTGMNCNQQHAGNSCWGIWRDEVGVEVPAYCIAGNVYSPTWNYPTLAQDACDDTYDTSCAAQWCPISNQAVAKTALGSSINGKGEIVAAAGALVLVGAGAFLRKKRTAKKAGATKLELADASAV